MISKQQIECIVQNGFRSIISLWSFLYALAAYSHLNQALMYNNEFTRGNFTEAILFVIMSIFLAGIWVYLVTRHNCEDS